MIIKKIHIQQFGKLQNYTLELNSQLNMICQENGFGKTTLLQFIKAMFYGIGDNRGKEISARKKYDPWNKVMNYGGNILFEYEGKNYCIYREFKSSKNKDILNVYDEKGEEVKMFNPIPGEVIFKMNEKTFIKTCFIEQKMTQINEIDDSNLKEKLTNALKTGDIYVSFTKVQEVLNEEKKKYDIKTRSIKGNIATNNLNHLMKLKKQQEQREEKHQIYLNKFEQIKKLKKQQENLNDEIKKIDEIVKYYNQKKKKEKYGSYLCYQKQILEKEKELSQKENQELKEPLSFKKEIYIILSSVLFIIGLMGAFISFWMCLLSLLGFIPLIFLFIKKQQYKKEIEKFGKSKQEHHNQIVELKRQVQEWKKISDETIKNDDLEDLKDIYQTFVLDSKMENQQIRDIEMETIKQEYQEIEKEISRLNGEISNFDYYENLNAEIENCESKKQEYELRFKSLNIALETLYEANQFMNTNYTPKLKQYFLKHLKEITFDEFQDIFVDSDLNVKLVTQFAPKELSYFSQGYQDLIYFALRVAVCEMLEQKVPLFLDDPFVNLDDKNYQKVINYLQKLQENYQIIYFNCYNRH